MDIPTSNDSFLFVHFFCIFPFLDRTMPHVYKYANKKCGAVGASLAVSQIGSLVSHPQGPFFPGANLPQAFSGSVGLYGGPVA